MGFAMMQKIVAQGEISQQPYVIFDNRKVVTGFRIKAFDIEDDRIEADLVSLSNLLSLIEEGSELRIYAKNCSIRPRGRHSRESSGIHFQTPEISLIFEYALKPTFRLGAKAAHVALEKEIASKFASIPLGELKRLELNPVSLSVDDLLAHSVDHFSTVEINRRSLWHQNEYLGIIQLIKPGSSPISPFSLADIFLNLERGSEFLIRIQAENQAKAALALEHRIKSNESGSNLRSQMKWKDAQEQIAAQELGGHRFLKYEAMVLMRASREEDLMKSIGKAYAELKVLGEWEIQGHGLAPALESYLLGGKSYWTLKETNQNLPVLLPLFHYAEDFDFTDGCLALHRRGLSPVSFNPFDNRYSSYSGVVIGQTGRGKSVFTNQLIRASQFDENSRILIVDVKGAHTHLVRALGGREITIDIESPSGFDPFCFLAQDKSLNAIEIVAEFVSVLIKREDEHKLPTEDKLEVEHAVKEFSEMCSEKPSLDEFIFFCADKIKRRNEIKRWSSKGLLKNVFKQQAEINSSKITYFNFAGITQASNSDVSTAVLASVMAKFSFDLKNKQIGEKLFFIADETPFFVKSCFESFRLLQKNVRSLNGCLFLIAQDSTDLVVNGDQSLLNNAATFVLFSIDGNKKDFQARLRLTDDEIEKLLSIQQGGGQSFSAFLLKDPIKSRICYLHLTHDEYWTSTTNPADKSLIEKLKRVFVGSNDSFLRSIVASSRAHGITLNLEQIR